MCSFVAEHSLPLSLAPDLIRLAQTLSRDHKALQSLSMERQTATYKLKQGLHEVERKRLVSKMINNAFSLNIDETTGKHNKKRLLNVLVCFFDPDLNRSVTRLYCTIEMTIVNAASVYEAVQGKLSADKIPLQNLISILSDSAAYMRGAQSGFQARMKQDAPHLLDIDGDICHHIHNVTKTFWSALDPEQHLPYLLDDLYRDFMYSADIREDLFSVCSILGCPEKSPKERVAHRWLSLLDATLHTQDLMDPLTVVYYSWLSPKDKELFKDRIQPILQKATPVGRQRIVEIQRRLKLKSLTQLGKSRKQRVAKKLFDRRRETDLLSATASSVLPMLKNFILCFEHSAPQIHKLHDEMVRLYRDFLKLFVRAEFLSNSGKKLRKMELDAAKLLPAQNIITGKCAPILSSAPSNVAQEYRERLLKSFTVAGSYMRNKLPLDNTLLRTLSLLDPRAFGQSDTAIILQKLPSFFPTISAPNFDAEITLLQSETDIQPCDDLDLDVWWSQVFQLNKFSDVRKIVSACLSIFTGPKVESSFSMLNDIVCAKASTMLTSTYEAIMATKYFLLSHNKSTVQLFCRPNALESPVDPSLAYHMQTSRARHENILKEKRATSKQRDQHLGVDPTNAPPSRKRKGCHLSASPCPLKKGKN